MGLTEISALQFANQEKTQFAFMAKPILVNTPGTTELKLKVTDKGNGNFEVEAIA